MKRYGTAVIYYTNILCFLLIAPIIILPSCTQRDYSYLPAYHFKSATEKPDYANLDYWAAHPWKKDPGDSVPKPLLRGYIKDSVADVFFIHPTTLTAKSDHRWNAPIDDAGINAKTDYTTILYQASVFNEKCRVFSPRYRQAHIRSFFVPDSVSRKYFDLAYEDVRNAFIYYLDHYNQGHPIIIASHSQGTVHAARLLKEFFENKLLHKKLVCAYLVGMPVPEKYYTTIKPCDDSLATGCFVSWRSFKQGYEGPQIVKKEDYRSVVINPLTWTRDSAYYPSSLNKGGILLNFNKIIPAAVSAGIHRNILWTSKPNIFGKIFFIKKNYHVGDINLFYMNIRENASARIVAFNKMNTH